MCSGKILVLPVIIISSSSSSSSSSSNSNSSTIIITKKPINQANKTSTLIQGDVLNSFSRKQTSYIECSQKYKICNYVHLLH
jgi:hypothetical protein